MGSPLQLAAAAHQDAAARGCSRLREAATGAGSFQPPATTASRKPPCTPPPPTTRTLAPTATRPRAAAAAAAAATKAFRTTAVPGAQRTRRRAHGDTDSGPCRAPPLRRCRATPPVSSDGPVSSPPQRAVRVRYAGARIPSSPAWLTATPSQPAFSPTSSPQTTHSGA